MSILESFDKKIDDVHPEYAKMIDRWRFWGDAYDGDVAFIKKVLPRHCRESEENHRRRVANGEVFNLCETVVDTFVHFLSRQNVSRDLANLETNELWELFIKDVDLSRTNYDIFFNAVSRVTSIYGCGGVLVDKPSSTTVRTLSDDIHDKVYPYFSIFTPVNVMDWDFFRDPATGRRVLQFLKLKEEGNTYLIWSRFGWERWTPVNDSHTKFAILDGDQGEHSLGEIPFVWARNGMDVIQKRMGTSDIKAVSRLQGAITRDLSGGSEVIEFAAFPMMRKPMETSETAPGDDVSGVTAILEFDPENPEAKPDWLESQVKEPIDSILAWIDKKMVETFRMKNLSSVTGIGEREAKSGIALRYEFQQLSAVLASKGRDLDETELSCIRLWMKWQEMDNIDEVVVSRPTVFNISDLEDVIDAIASAKANVHSETFRKLCEKKIVKATFPDESGDTIREIESEIDASTASTEPFTTLEE